MSRKADGSTEHFRCSIAPLSLRASLYALISCITGPHTREDLFRLQGPSLRLSLVCKSYNQFQKSSGPPVLRESNHRDEVGIGRSPSRNRSCSKQQQACKHAGILYSICTENELHACFYLPRSDCCDRPWRGRAPVLFSKSLIRGSMSPRLETTQPSTSRAGGQVLPCTTHNNGQSALFDASKDRSFPSAP